MPYREHEHFSVDEISAESYTDGNPAKGYITKHSITIKLFDIDDSEMVADVISRKLELRFVRND